MKLEDDNENRTKKKRTQVRVGVREELEKASMVVEDDDSLTAKRGNLGGNW